MGWTESPPSFCAGTEMAWDLMKIMLPNVKDLMVHPLEHKMEPRIGEMNMSKAPRKEDDMSISNGDDDKWLPPTPTPHKTLFEVFVNNFMAATNDLGEENLSQVLRSMLHAIHAIFPPPEVTGHAGEDSVSI